MRSRKAPASARKRDSAFEIIASSLRRRCALRQSTSWLSASSGSAIFLTSTSSSGLRPGRLHGAWHGYLDLDLGMGQDAWDELEEMPPQDRARLEVVVMRLVILQSMDCWDKGAEIALGAVRAYPECPDLYLMGAYAIRRVEDIQAALDFLVSGKECMEEVAAYWFNVGSATTASSGISRLRRIASKRRSAWIGSSR